MKFSKKLAVVLATVAVSSFQVARGQEGYTTDIRTTTTPTSSILATRLFQNGFATSNTNIPSPIGTIMWFVADTGFNGINTNFATSGNVNATGIGPGVGILQADDRLLWVDNVDGAKLQDNPGQLQRIGAPDINGFPTNFSTVPIYAYLFNFTNATGQLPNGNTNGAGFTSPQANSHFAIFSLGIRTPDFDGGFTSTTWFISANIFADQYTIVAVPEPSTMALLGVSVLGMFTYRRFRK